MVRRLPHVALQLLRFSSEEELESLYYNSIKQALYLRQGTTKTMQTLPKSQQQQLWDALKTGTYAPRTRWPLSSDPTCAASRAGLLQ